MWSVCGQFSGVSCSSQTDWRVSHHVTLLSKMKGKGVEWKMARGEMGLFLIILLQKAHFYSLTCHYLKRLAMSITQGMNKGRGMNKQRQPGLKNHLKRLGFKSIYMRFKLSTQAALSKYRHGQYPAVCISIQMRKIVFLSRKVFIQSHNFLIWICWNN